MKVRFFLDEEDPEVAELPLVEVPVFLDLLKSIGIDKDGTIYKVSSINYDVNQHAIDVMCMEAG